MNTKRISMVSGTALLALTATASAGPMSAATSNIMGPPQTQTEPVAYRYRHHYRHYGYHHRYYHRYGWNPGAAVAGAALGLATLPFALATGGYYYGNPYYGYPYYYY
ncbi:MAG: hypothetical protein ACR2KT_16580 [Methylocella sp.]